MDVCESVSQESVFSQDSQVSQDSASIEINNTVSEDSQNRYAVKQGKVSITRNEIPKKKSPTASSNMRESKTIVSKGTGKSRSLNDIGDVFMEENSLSWCQEQTISKSELKMSGSHEKFPIMHHSQPVMGSVMHKAPIASDVGFFMDERLVKSQPLLSGSYKGSIGVDNCNLRVWMSEAFTGEGTKGSELISANGANYNSQQSRLNANDQRSPICGSHNTTWIKEGNWYINQGPLLDENNRKRQVIGTTKSSEAISTNSVTMSQTAKLTECVTTTTAITTSLVHAQAGLMQSTMIVTTATTTVTTASGCFLSEPSDSKRKTTDPEEGRPELKKRIVEKSNGASVNEDENDNLNAEQMMRKLLNEVVGIKTLVEEVKETVKSIQTENSEWRLKHEALAQEVSEMKNSLNQAHQLIVDEAEKRKTEMKTLGEQMTAKLTETATDPGEIQSLNDKMTKMSEDFQGIKKDCEELKIPVTNLSKQVSELTGETEFAVKRMIVAQKVWYREDEDFDKVASVIIHTGLNLPEIKIQRVVRKSGRNRGSGLLKIELETEENVESVLKAKARLNKSQTKELRTI